MGHTLAISTRAILSKRVMGTDMSKNISPANMYAVENIMALAMFLPVSATVEGPRIKDVWAAAVESDYPKTKYVPMRLHSRDFFACEREADLWPRIVAARYMLQLPIVGIKNETISDR